MFPSALQSEDRQKQQTELIEKAEAFEQMILLLPEMIQMDQNLNFDCPLNWSIRSADFFGVSEHAVRTARRVIKETVLDLENHFYQYDEFSTVSVGRNNHVQKNLFAI